MQREDAPQALRPSAIVTLPDTVHGRSFEDRPRSGTLIDSEMHLGTAGNRDPFSLCH